MPARVSTRNPTASRVTRKSSVPTLNSRASTSSRPSANIPDEGPSTTLRTKICTIFADAQKSTVGHRKLVVNLRKIHEECCYEPQSQSKKNAEQFTEEDFNSEIARCVIRVLLVKKSESVGDRIVRFLGQFLRHASEKDAALVPEEEIDETQAFPETPASRLTSHILSVLLPLLMSKEKTVRYRSTQIISHIVNSLDSIDDEYYHLLRAGLIKRIRDKEAMVRVQAVLGLGRLASNEGEEEQDSDSDDSSGLLEKLLDVLQNDPSADVRRSLLLNLPLTPATLPYLLERARDLDPATRRALYSRLLPALGDFRHLSLSMREKLLRWGLRDRDDNVRKATARLFRERWIEDCAGTSQTEDGKTEAAPPNTDALLELMERIDIVNAGVEEGIAHEAMKEFWEGRPDYQQEVTFEDSFWDNLTAERIFLARSFNDFCRQGDNERKVAMIEDKMPEVTKLAFFLQRYTNNLVAHLKQAGLNGELENEDEAVELEFVVEQLLHIAITLDYSDEIGRRKMFALLRETLAIPELPEDITKLSIEVLRLVCGSDSAGERDFCGVVLEAVAEVHDTIAPEPTPSVEDGDESFHSAKSDITSESTPKASTEKKLLVENAEEDEEKAIKEILVNMKCLHIAQCMLQNVGANLQDNVHLVTMLNNLVVPAVRSHEAPIRERGLLCLGLCCLLDKTLAEENLTLFLHCFSKGHPALQVTALHILADILTTHPTLLQAAMPAPLEGTHQKPIFKVFSKGLKASHEPDVQAAATTALCKLMLTKVIADADLLRQLVTTFFEPATRDNAATRQALSYFLPVFAHSRKESMELLAGVVPAVVHACVGLGEELEEDEEMVGLTTVGNMLVDWTDPRKLVVLDEEVRAWDEVGKKEAKAVNGDVHLDLAVGLLEKVMAHGCSKEEKKALLSMLGKLYISPNSDAEKLQTVHELVTEAVEAKVASDATGRNALTKLQTALAKAVGDGKVIPSSRKSMAPAAPAEDEVVDSVEPDEVPAAVEDDMTKMSLDEKDVGDDSIVNDLLEDEDEL